MPRENKNTYFPIYNEIACSSAVVNKSTGESLEWSLQEKVFYCWMLAEQKSFQKSGGKIYHNHDIIAGRLGVAMSSVERYIKSLVQIGLISKQQICKNKFIKSNSYTVVDVFDGGYDLVSCLSRDDVSMMNLLNNKGKDGSARQENQVGIEPTRCNSITHYDEQDYYDGPRCFDDPELYPY